MPDVWFLPQGDSNVSTVDQAMWLDFLSDNEFQGLLATFTYCEMPLVRISPVPGLVQIQFSYLSNTSLDTRGWLKKLALSPLIVIMEAPSLGSARRTEVCVRLPEGVLVHTRPALIRIPDDAVEPTLGRERREGRGTFRRGRTPETVIVSTEGVCESDYRICFGYGPDLSALALPAAIGAFLAFLILGLGAFLQREYAFLSDISQEHVESVMVILVLLPTLFSACLVKDGEHELRRRLLGTLRIGIGVWTVSPIMAGMTLLFHTTGYGSQFKSVLTEFWFSCSIFSLLAAIWFSIAWWKGIKARCRSSESSWDDAVEYPIIESVSQLG